jgi:hypothetical protein
MEEADERGGWKRRMEEGRKRWRKRRGVAR